MSNRKTILMAGGLSVFALTVMVGVASTLLGFGATPSGLATQAMTRQADQQSQQQQQRQQQVVMGAVLPSQEPVGDLASISLQNAIDVAKKNAPKAMLKGSPELVNYNGVVAYEVPMNKGLVYVDANSGAVLAKGFVNSSSEPLSEPLTVKERSVSVESPLVESKANVGDVKAFFEGAEHGAARSEGSKHRGRQNHEREHNENEERHDG